MFQDRLVNCSDQTDYDMLLLIAILVRRSLLRPTDSEDLKRSGKDWTLMQHSYLILLLELLLKDLIERLLNQNHRSTLRAVCWISNSIL